jgi:site-specific DNA recombinase
MLHTGHLSLPSSSSDIPLAVAVPAVALYARVSTDRQAEAKTIEQQVDALRTYAAQQGLLVAAEHEYRDDGYSGARLDRPALDRLRDAVMQGAVDLVLVTSPDRLARRYAYQVWLLEEFERLGCRVLFLERPPTGDPQDTLVIQIRGAVAEYERALIADRMRRGRLAALRAGRLLPWSTPPYGYRADPLCPRDPAGLRVEETEADRIRQIFAWYLEGGCNLYQIACRLTAAAIPTPRGAAIWNTSTVRKILVNTAYAGTAYGNRLREVPAKRRFPLLTRTPKTEGGTSMQVRPREEWIPVAIAPIVSTEQFAQAHERLRHNQQWSRRNTKGEYLLRQLVSCRRCGLAHGVRTNERYGYYHCKGSDTLVQRRRPEPCHAPQVRADHLDHLVWEDVCRLLLAPDILQAALEHTQQQGLDSDARLARRHDLQRQDATIQQQIQRLIDAYTAQVLTLDELRERRTQLEARRASVERERHELEAATQQEVQLATVATQLEQFRSVIAAGLDNASFAQRRAIVELLIDRVVVDTPDVEIRYIIPLTGLAQRKGVLPLRHRAAQ